MSIFYSEPGTTPEITAAQIYGLLPIPWLRPPVWLLRYVEWSQGRAQLVKADDAPDVFRLASQANEEWIIADAKIRPVVIFRTPPSHAHAVSIIPIYSFAEHKNQSFLARVRAGDYPDKFYLPASGDYGLKEAYADFSLVQPLDTKLLSPSLRLARLAPTAWQALLTRYSRYLLGR